MTSRPNRELRLIDLLGALEVAGLEFLVFGAVAGALHGHVRATVDLDVVVRPIASNLRRLTDWLQADGARLALNPDRAFGEEQARAVLDGANATVLTSLGQLDAIQRLPGLAPWEQLAERAQRYEIDGRELRVVDRATLIARKRARATAQDLVDADALGALEEDSET